MCYLSHLQCHTCARPVAGQNSDSFPPLLLQSPACTDSGKWRDGTHVGRKGWIPVRPMCTRILSSLRFKPTLPLFSPWTHTIYVAGMAKKTHRPQEAHTDITVFYLPLAGLLIVPPISNIVWLLPVAASSMLGDRIGACGSHTLN